jgi:hypothetical protein
MERRPEQVENKLIFRENNKNFRLSRETLCSPQDLPDGGRRAQRKIHDIA